MGEHTIKSKQSQTFKLSTLKLRLVAQRLRWAEG